MTPACDLVSEKALLDLAARSIGLEVDGLGRMDLLDDLEISTSDLLALVAALEDQCEAILPDCDLARCETLGDLIDHLRAGTVLGAAWTLDRRADQTADAGRHDHGQRPPEGDPRRRAPRRRSSGFRPGHTEQRQAS